MDERQFLLKTWDDTWDQSWWWPAFSVAFQDLSAAQAAWKPAPQRHSIWQILNHMVLWRDVCVRRTRGEKPSHDEIDRRNWEEAPDPTDAAWRDALARLERSHRQVHEALADDSLDIQHLRYLLMHDVHHLGQVTYIRALLGLPPQKYG